jgi:hypothetical protein
LTTRTCIHLRITYQVLTLHSQDIVYK